MKQRDFKSCADQSAHRCPKQQVSLLGLLLEAEVGQEGKELWIQEVVALLEPAARQSKAVAAYLAMQMATICRLILTSEEPLSLSLGEMHFPASVPNPNP